MKKVVVIIRIAFPEWYPQYLRQETINRYIQEERITGGIPKTAKISIEQILMKTEKALILKK